MATVAELVEDIAEILSEKPETVNAYARALIDSGDLPKSRGRSIAQVDYRHIVKLFMAVILSPKIKETAESVEEYYNMRRPGVGPDFPSRLQDRAGGQLCDFVQVIHAPDGKKEEALRRKLVDSKIVFTINWPEIEFDFGHGKLMRFKEGGNSSFWEGYHRRCVILSGRAFLMLGAGKGRDYVVWESAEE
ncbi:hypothetical protein [Microbulbifer sp. S227A]|uniref:hypothetical protein n=1 Tax=Microbulbifer sp. S227A TaxID=3415131 RepID=UPI003C7BED77